MLTQKIKYKGFLIGRFEKTDLGLDIDYETYFDLSEENKNKRVKKIPKNIFYIDLICGTGTGYHLVKTCKKYLLNRNKQIYEEKHTNIIALRVAGNWKHLIQTYKKYGFGFFADPCLDRPKTNRKLSGTASGQGRWMSMCIHNKDRNNKQKNTIKDEKTVDRSPQKRRPLRIKNNYL